jgi:ferric-dicitrate binding protein FerR (iron transport regulator)
MHSETNQPDYTLVSKYLAGEATPAEAMLVHEWISDPENKKNFDEIVKAWNLLPGASPMQLPDAVNSWSHIENAITAPGRKNPFFRKIFPYAVAAAVTGIALLITFTWNNSTNDGRKLQQRVSSDISKSATTEAVAHNLPDGSVVFINKHSSVRYTSLYNKQNRTIRLEGEAFFTVTPDASKPFIIEAGGVEIKVTGTAFNVRNIAAEDRIAVQVQTGTVEMYTTKHRITIEKGQTGIFYKQTSTLVLENGIDINSISYATKSFSFNDLTLKEAARYLENAFDVSIQMDDTKFADCRITAAFENKSLIYILEVINATLNTSYRKEGDTIIIEGDGCK